MNYSITVKLSQIQHNYEQLYKYGSSYKDINKRVEINYQVILL